jgi:hypothetical protein
MSDWIRSLTVLAMTGVGVVVLTLGLATLIVPRPAALADPGQATPSGSSGATPTPGAHEPEPSDGIPHVGGRLAFSGDRDGTLALTRDSLEGTYGLIGSDGRMTLGQGQPPEVTQISFDGWEFFPDSGQCTLTPGEPDAQLGLATAEISCTGLVEIRDKGTVSVEGTINLPADRAAPRTLPQTGGTASVGGETWTFEQAFLTTWNPSIYVTGAGEFSMELVDPETLDRLLFSYDADAHLLGLAAVEREGELIEVPPGACTIARDLLGKPNPRDLAVELVITCPRVDVPGLGSVPVEATVVVDELGYPF